MTLPAGISFHRVKSEQLPVHRTAPHLTDNIARNSSL